jgi:CyaY protein
MDEQRFRHLADAAFRQILDGFEDIDADDADVETAGNTLTILFRDGSRAVVNTQAATCQIWLAGGQRAWHFDYDEASGKWLHDKGTGEELFATIARLTSDTIGETPGFS